MRPLLITNGMIIDPGRGIDAPGDLLIAESKIASMAGKYGYDADYDIMNAAGLVVCPGFIDFHCHLRQPGFEEKETIATGTLAAARGGFTTVCCMPNTNPPIDNVDVLDYVNNISAAEGVVRVLPFGCITIGRAGKILTDMEWLAESGAVAFSDDGDTVGDANLMRRAMELSKKIGVPISDHCEDPALIAGGQMNEGEIAQRLGLQGIPPAAEENIVARDIELARQTGAQIHIAHVSTAGSVEIIRKAKKDGVKVTAEVTPHHLTMTEDAVTGYNTNAKVNPPLRKQRDIDALIKGLRDDVIDIIATDHAPHTAKEKSLDFIRAPFGISGLETALGSLMALVHRGDININLLVAALTANPARIIGERFGKLGSLDIGCTADITIFDPDKEWIVDAEKFASKGKNTPLNGKKLRGKVMATICGGNIVYRDDSLLISSGGGR